MTVTTHILGGKYEITVETKNQKTAEAIMQAIQEQKEREKQERKCAESVGMD